MNRVTKVAIAGLLVLVPVLSRAESTACSTPTPLVPDGRITTSTIPAATTFYYFVGTTSGYSYSLEVRYPVGLYDAGLTARINTVCPLATSIGRNTVTIDPQFQCTLCGVQTGVRVSFTASNENYWVHIQNTSGAPQTYSISMSETMQYSPAWSTNGSFNTFYSLFNTTNATCTGTLTLYDTAGVVADTQPLTITPGATGSTNTSAMGTPRNMAGTAKFNHDCPPGAFLAEAAIANFSISPTPYFQ